MALPFCFRFASVMLVKVMVPKLPSPLPSPFCFRYAGKSHVCQDCRVHCRVIAESIAESFAEFTWRFRFASVLLPFCFRYAGKSNGSQIAESVAESVLLPLCR